MRQILLHSSTFFLKRMLNFSFHIFNSQIWLNQLKDECHLDYITKLGKKKKPIQIMIHPYTSMDVILLV
jgi:hypothetical protein